MEAKLKLTKAAETTPQFIATGADVLRRDMVVGFASQDAAFECARVAMAYGTSASVWQVIRKSGQSYRCKQVTLLQWRNGEVAVHNFA